MDYLKLILANLDTIVTAASIAASLVFAVNSSARGAMAAVFKIMKDGMEMTPEQRLQKASDLMGQKFPYIPEALRKYIIQWLFDSMSNAAQKKT
jgi:hypothetical protein